MTEIENIIEMCRVMAEDHEPDGWPAVQMKTIAALCDEVQRLQLAYSHTTSLLNEANEHKQQLRASLDQAEAEVRRARHTGTGERRHGK